MNAQHRRGGRKDIAFGRLRIGALGVVRRFPTLTSFAFASVLCVEACVESDGADRVSSADASTSAFGTSCIDGCTADARATCNEDGPTLPCSEPLSCHRGACVTPCDAAALERASAGCSFLTPVPDSSSVHGACFAITLSNPSTVPAKIAIEYEGLGLDVTRILRAPREADGKVVYEALPSPEIAPGGVVVAFVSGGNTDDGACPAEVGGAGIPLDLAVHGPGLGSALHVRSSVPVTAHAMYPFGGGTTGMGAATVLYPVHSWDFEAMAAELDLAKGSGPVLQLVSAEAQNAIDFTPRSAIRGGGTVISSTPAGQTLTLRVDLGGVVQFSQIDAFSLTGSPVVATRPIGVFAGSACAHSGVPACDPLFQQIPPSDHLGTEYVAVGPRDRFEGVEEQTPWQIVGLHDGTELSYEPETPEGAPSTVGRGQIVQFRSRSPFVMTGKDATRPFLVSGMMESCRVYGTDDDCRGDPEAVIVAPTTRYGAEAAFFADPSYPETNVVLVRARRDGRFADVALDCVPKVEGWQSVGDRFEFARIDLSRGNYEPQGACRPGSHWLRSEGPTTATVWGWGSAATRKAGGPNTESVSHAYPVLAEPRRAVDLPGVAR